MLGPLVLTVEGLFGAGVLLLLVNRAGAIRDTASRRADRIKLVVYFVLIHGLLAAAYWGRTAAGALLGVALVAGIREARACSRRSPGVPASLLIAPLAIGFGHALVAPGAPWFSSFALLILLVASTDSFAQLTGRLWGKHPLAPRVSPSKTVEGWIGGFIAATGVALACGFLAPEIPAAGRFLLGAATSLGATAGDLLFSAAKRRAGIKDFSSLLPGHGGVLDRFDSLALAAPVYVWVRASLVAGPPMEGG